MSKAHETGPNCKDQGALRLQQKKLFFFFALAVDILHGSTSLGHGRCCSGTLETHEQFLLHLLPHAGRTLQGVALEYSMSINATSSSRGLRRRFRKLSQAAWCSCWFALSSCACSSSNGVASRCCKDVQRLPGTNERSNNHPVKPMFVHSIRSERDTTCGST